MAGRNPHQALHNFIDPLQRVLSILSQANLVYRQESPGEIQALTTSEEPMRIRCRDSTLWLFLGQQYEIVEDDHPERGPWKVSTRQYRYRIDADEFGGEIYSWHWHPNTQLRPHVHAHRSDTPDAHIPTGRVSIEAIFRFMIEDLGAEPRRKDWEEVLSQTEGAFEEWRTWHSDPPVPQG